MMPIKRVSLNKQIMGGILDILRNGDYGVGDKLPTEKELATLLGVGRNSIREALKALALADIIESTPGKGTFLKIKAVDIMMRPDGLINVINSVTYKELMQVRIIFEVETAGLAAQMAGKNKKELEAFKEAWARLNQTLKERSDSSKTGFDFHIAIVNLSGNKLLKKLLNPIWEELKLARKFAPITKEESYEVERDFHDRIFHAIVNQNPEEAKRIMREHLENTEKARYYE